MVFEITILLLAIIITGLAVWMYASKFYDKKLEMLKEENFKLKKIRDCGSFLIILL